MGLPEAFLPLSEGGLPYIPDQAPPHQPRVLVGPPLTLGEPQGPSPQPPQPPTLSDPGAGPFQLPIPVHSEDFTTQVASGYVHHHPRPQSSPHPPPAVPGRPPTAGKPLGQASASPEPRSSCSPLPLSHTGVPFPGQTPRKAGRGRPSWHMGSQLRLIPLWVAHTSPGLRSTPGKGERGEVLHMVACVLPLVCSLSLVPGKSCEQKESLNP